MFYARWTAHSGRNASAPYVVTHSGGTTQIDVDQRYNGGEWYSLGVYDLAPSSGHQVGLTDLGSGTTIADSIKVVPQNTVATPLVAADAVKFIANDAEDVLYVHADHLASPQKMTDDTGAVVWDAAYTPFGQEASITGTAANDNRFPGQFRDAETALHYNYWRDYDPVLGRYIQSDPIGLGGGLNTYGYVGGNPLTRIDQTGEVPIVPIVLGALALWNYYDIANDIIDTRNTFLDPCSTGNEKLAAIGLLALGVVDPTLADLASRAKTDAVAKRTLKELKKQAPKLGL